MGMMKKRLSNLPAAFSGLFSLSAKLDAADASPQHQDLLHRQPNGSTKRKRGRRRIALAVGDAEADDVDDGRAARGLNYEEVALADNITEHDLAAEDEQTRQSGYNVFLLRRQQRDALAATGGPEDDVLEDDVEDDEEEEECEEEDSEDVQEQVAKRSKLETTVSLPQMRRMPLGSSTPAASLVPASVAVGGARSNSSQLAPHRRTRLNLYQNQRNREPEFNFFAGNETAAEGITGDLPHSDRRSLNIPFGSFGTDLESAGAGDSNSVCDPVELNFHDNNGEAHHNHNHNNSRLEFYGNLQSTKSLFKRSRAQPTLHNSTWSLNSLSNRRTFNSTIYGSTSALSEGGLLSHRGSAPSSASSSSSPFYQGPTAFGGNSANNRFFNRSASAAAASSSLLANYSRGNMPVQPTGMKPTEMRSKNAAETGGGGGAISSSSGSGSDARNSAMSKSTHRILHLLDGYSTPLIDVKRMGSTLKEHQSSRRLRDNAPAGSPYSVPRNSSGASLTGSLQSPAAGLAEMRPNKLLLPTMQQLLERRCLNRVTTNTRNLMQTQRQSIRAADSESSAVVVENKKAATETVPSSVAATAAAVACVDQQPPNPSSYTNKMRSKLSHQTGRRKASCVEEAAPPPPLDLPQISFPAMASTPKFDLVINKIPLHKPPVVVATPTASKIENNASTSTKPNILVQQPMDSVICADIGSATPTPAKRVNCTFGNPTPLSSNVLAMSKADLSVFKRTFSFAAPTPLDADSEPVKEQQQHHHPAINGLPSQGFGDRFMKSSKEWDCDVCMVRNKAEAAKCVACETPKPGAAKSAPLAAPSPLAPIVPIGAGFGDRFKKSSSAWECETCMVTNKEEDSRCIACVTPRRTAMATKANNFAITSTAGAGFGDAFKVKAGQWECPTCMLFNESTAVECVSCQTANPRLASSNSEQSSSSSSSSSANYAASAPASPHATANNVSSRTSFTTGTVAAPEPDAGFKQLVASQKAASWNCDACLAQNDMSRNKCLCCEQLKPGSSTTAAAATNTSGGLTVPGGGGSSVPKFTFGFAPAKPALIKETTKTTEETDLAAPPVPAPAPPTTSISASSSTATTTSASTSTPALAGFRFGAPPSSSSTMSSSSANSIPAAKPMFCFSGTGTSGAVSSTSSQPKAPNTETLSFGAANTITTPSSIGFTPKPVLNLSAIPASTSAPAPAPAPAAAAAVGFTFGTQPQTVSTPASAGTFLFGQPPAGTPAAPAVNAGVSSIFGSSAPTSNSSTPAASSVITNSTFASSVATVAPSNPPLFSFGSGGLGAVTTTTTTMPSFGWPSNGITGMSSSNPVTSTAAVSSSQSIHNANSSNSSSSSLMCVAPSGIASSSSSLFGSTATTAPAISATALPGGNGNMFIGSIKNSTVTLGGSNSNNIFGNPTTTGATFGQGAAAVASGGIAKLEFNFSGAAAATATVSISFII
ncbi:hypothetical protein KR032_008196 [Drosophila birchii]|nr:hypothetical protein KR032_008196 [Drosophila birchii]